MHEKCASPRLNIGHVDPAVSVSDEDGDYLPTYLTYLAIWRASPLCRRIVVRHMTSH